MDRATWQRVNPYKNLLSRLKDKALDGFDLKLVGRWPLELDKNCFGKQWCCLLGTCHRNVPRDFINLFIAPNGWSDQDWEGAIRLSFMTEI